MKAWIEKTILVLAAIGAINWGLTGLGWNAVEKLLGFVDWLPNIVYYIIALCGIWALVKIFKE